MEILILGVVLLVLGVGATYLYDKHKAVQTDMAAKREAARAWREKEAQAVAASFAKAQGAAKKTRSAVDKTIEDIFGTPTWTATTTTTKTTKTGAKKISQKRKLPSASSPVSADDVSINSQLTIQELIAKIESMKKK